MSTATARPDTSCFGSEIPNEAMILCAFRLGFCRPSVSSPIDRWTALRLRGHAQQK
jgi:hypothetical protein